MICVLDASAVLAYLAGEPGGEVVDQYLHSGVCAIHAVNLCEVLYHLRRKGTAEEAEETLEDLRAFGVVTRNDFGLPFLHLVADYKTAPGQVSLADCFGLALAQQEELPFITSDRHELMRVAERGSVTIEFIR